MNSSGTAIHSPSPANVLADTIQRMVPWLKVLAVISFFYGAMAAFSLVGLFLAWIPVLLGIWLYLAASRARAVVTSKQWQALPDMLRKLYFYFILTTVLHLIGLAALFWFLVFESGILGQPQAGAPMFF